jgi:hypothetical protein
MHCHNACLGELTSQHCNTPNSLVLVQIDMSGAAQYDVGNGARGAKSKSRNDDLWKASRTSVANCTPV